MNRQGFSKRKNVKWENSIGLYMYVVICGVYRHEKPILSKLFNRSLLFKALPHECRIGQHMRND